MSAAENAPTAGEYIGHHLTHLQNQKMAGVVDFSVFNLDSLIWSVLLGVVGCFLLWRAAKGATSEAPGRFQAAVEILVEMVDNQAKGVIDNPKSRAFVGPLALTVFVWIFLMNFMDMLPVDFLPHLWHSAGPALGFKDYLRVVQTLDEDVGKLCDWLDAHGHRDDTLVIQVGKFATVFGARRLFISTLKVPMPVVANCTTVLVMVGTAK